jgi:phosphate transport system substrate-binding protein
MVELKVMSREDTDKMFRTTKFQASHFKRIPMSKIETSKQMLRYGFNSPFPSLAKEGRRGSGHWNVEIGNYLEFGIWRLGFLFFILLISTAMGCQRSRAGITVAGSTSVEPFAELLAEEFMMLHPESHIYVQGGGSTAGIEAVITQAANIGMSSRNLIGEEKKLHTVTIAKDAIAVIIHPTNRIQDLSLDQIRDTFSGKIRNWRELGGPSHPIDVVTREEGSGTRESFQKFVMGKEDISLGALVQDSNGAVRQVIVGNVHAIGFISLGLVNEQVKAVKISGVEPSLENVNHGKYTLVRPFLFVFNGEPTGEAKPFLEFVLSPAAQELLLKEGLVPVIEAQP